MLYIKENIECIKNEIHHTCLKVDRDPADIYLLAVTKTIDAERINEVIAQGIEHVGENKVQEIMDKYEEVRDVNWHMIGHLQTNKVKYIIDKVQMIHSLDRIQLAEEINKRAKQQDKVIDVLIQVNVAQEDTKFGIEEKDIYEFLKQLKPLENIRVKGLMMIAPFEENPEDVRIYFKKLKSLFDEIGKKEYEHVEMKYLSMGMSNDYKVAIEEGSNMIRVGTAIFGKRNYQS